MNNLKRLTTLLSLLLLGFFANAQTITNDNDSIMKSNGKIYVVMTVVIVIIAGLFLYVLNVDRKISKLEKEN